MATSERERRSQRKLVMLIILLVIAYGLAKHRHVAIAMQAYEGQQLHVDTTGAAK